MNIDIFEEELATQSHSCQVCGEDCKNRRVLGWHLRNHGVSTREYIEKHYYPDGTPTCICGCGKEVTWHKVQYRYRSYVTGHNRKGFRKPRESTEKRKYSHNLAHFKCAECEFETDRMKSLTSHVKSAHGLAAPQYTIKHIYGGIRPVCEEVSCSNTPRYVQMKFKTFCEDHARLAYIRGGKKGGKADAWNRGLTKETDERIKIQAENARGVGNPFFGKSHNADTLQKISDTKRLDWEEVNRRVRFRHSALRILSKKSEYETQDTQLRIRCNTCESEFKASLFNLVRGTRCLVCYPSGSSQELEISQFLSSFGVHHEMHNRRILGGLEIDLYVPDKKLAIEYHGLWWHREDKEGMNRQSHQKKFYECEKRGIHLIQIFADEWRNKRSLVESMIGIVFQKAKCKGL